ncbi:RICIN domain-containing protein [Saccharothrix sp. NRRL B-16314]|uniref:RICIN domain-containing protein n=1 Tax=Saccharothrix sp. NRRL B-16314 TaxID=1463825 RepID=UPI000A47A04B|nr:RICIN domain-containing protein [Saccharothrix sp. NRRL B-16314]
MLDSRSEEPDHVRRTRWPVRAPRLPWAAATAALVLGLTITTSPTATAATPVAGSTYQVSVNNSGKCLDVVNGAAEDGAPVHQWDCWNGAMQQWALRTSGSGTFALVNVATGKCLDIAYGTTEMFVQAQQWSC